MTVMRWQRPEGFLSLCHAPNASPPKLWASHPSSQPTPNPPEPLLLQPRPKEAPPSPHTGEGRQDKEVSSSQGREGNHQDRAVFVCQALG